jgi:hypothetical protein
VRRPNRDGDDREACAARDRGAFGRHDHSDGGAGARRSDRLSDLGDSGCCRSIALSRNQLQTSIVVDLSQPDDVALALNGVLQRFERRGPLPRGARELLIEIAHALWESNPAETGLSPVQWVRAREIAAAGIESLEQDFSPAVSIRVEDALRDWAVLFSRGTFVPGVEEQARRRRAQAWIRLHLRSAGAPDLPWGNGTLLDEPVLVLTREMGTYEVWSPDGEMLGAVVSVAVPEEGRHRWELRDSGGQSVLGLMVGRRGSADPDVLQSATGAELVRLGRPGIPSVAESQRSGNSVVGKLQRTGFIPRWLTVGGRPSGRLTARRRLLGNSSVCVEDGDRVETARVTRTSMNAESGAGRCYVVVVNNSADDTLRAVALMAGLLWESDTVK